MFKKIDKIISKIENGEAETEDFETAIQELSSIKKEYNNFNNQIIDNDKKINPDDKYKNKSIDEIIDELKSCDNTDKIYTLLTTGMYILDEKNKKMKKSQVKITQAIEESEKIKLVDITESIMEMVNKVTIKNEPLTESKKKDDAHKNGKTTDDKDDTEKEKNKEDDSAD